MSNPMFANPTIMPSQAMRPKQEIRAKQKMDRIKDTSKFNYVMSEYGKGELKSGSGQIVQNPKEAVAIAAAETGQSYKQKQSAQKKSDRFGFVHGRSKPR